MDVSIDAITNNIQLALAPVFLLTAVATLINAISARLARSVDRMRAIQHRIQEGGIQDQDMLAHMMKEANEAKVRGRLCTAAIFFDVLSGVFISLTVLELFSFKRVQCAPCRPLCHLDFCTWINILYDFTFYRAGRSGLCLSFSRLEHTFSKITLCKITIEIKKF